MSIKPPKSFIPGDRPAEAWEKYRQRIEIYWTAAELSTKPLKNQKAILLHVVGEEALSVYNTFEFEVEPRPDGTVPDVDDVLTIEMILDAFSQHYTPYKNETYIRHVFFETKQKENQSFDEFIIEIRTKAKDCGFGELADSLIRDKIVGGIYKNELRKKLLGIRNLSLANCIDICRANEEATKQNEKMVKQEEVHKINIKKKNTGTIAKQNPVKRFNGNQFVEQKVCWQCGINHEYGKCPAKGKQCIKCKKLNHFARVCKTKKVNEIRERTDSENSEEFVKVGAIKEKINVCDITKEWVEEIKIENLKIKFKLDTGSAVNIIPLKLWNRISTTKKIQKANKKLISYSNNEIETEGYSNLKCIHKNKTRVLEFYITKNTKQPLLGMKGIEQLNLLKRVGRIEEEGAKIGSEESRCQEIIEEFKDVFKGTGCVKTKYKIQLREQYTPCISRCRRIPQARLEEVKKELRKLESQGIITKTDEFTEWVHPIVVVEKAENNGVRICMDPRPLNKYIQRPTNQMYPSLEEITTEVGKNNSKYFSVLDVKTAFHQIPLDDESSKLCTITTPFGKYKYNRLPYGLSCASDIFQQEINKITSQVKNTIAYADDILIHGFTLEQHNDTLLKVLKLAKEMNIKFKENKTQLAVRRIRYLGFMISEDGVEIANDKIEAIVKMNSPENKKQLQTFLGMVNYLSRFITHISEETLILRNLLKNDSAWIWTTNEEIAFNNIKKLITAAPILKLYDPEKEIQLSTDASKESIGAIMEQEGKPIAYYSASLNKSQTNYSVIEKELLAITAACEHFHYYLYGRDFVIKTDHKPLIGLLNKPIDDMSPRLQSMVLRILRYKCTLQYQPGKTMYVPDALSRLKYSEQKPVSNKLVDESLRVQSIVLASKERIKELQEETLSDAELRQVNFYLKNGWPKKASSVNQEAKKYYNNRYEIYEQKGLLFRNKQLIIPTKLRMEMLQKIHTGHNGINSCIKRAQEALYWPNMDQDITNYISLCTACQRNAKANTKEPLHVHPIPDLPWEKIAMDFMEFKNQKYLLITDYYSKFTVINPMKSTKATDVIERLREIFGTLGLPAEVMSDNGPPFDSYQLKQYMKEEEIKHTTSSPMYPRSNGLIERHVQTFKNMLRKSPNENICNLMRIYNSTPKNNLQSPAEILFGRRIRTNLPISKTAIRDNNNRVKQSLQERQQRQKKYYDRQAGPIRQLNKNVLLQTEQRKWIPGKIVGVDETPNSYWIGTGNGGLYRRNKIHIKNMNVPKEEIKSQEQREETTERIGQKEETAGFQAEETTLRRSERQRTKPKKYEDFI